MTEKEKPEWGWVYVMQVNTDKGAEIKIGYTTMTPERRALSLTIKTGINHHTTWANWVWNPAEVEAHFHKVLSKHRGSLGNEYFSLKSMHDEDEPKRKPNYLFRTVVRPLEKFGERFRETYPMSEDLDRRTR